MDRGTCWSRAQVLNAEIFSLRGKRGTRSHIFTRYLSKNYIFTKRLFIGCCRNYIYIYIGIFIPARRAGRPNYCRSRHWEASRAVKSAAAGPVNPGRHLQVVPRVRADHPVDPSKFCSHSGPCSVLQCTQSLGKFRRWKWDIMLVP